MIRASEAKTAAVVNLQTARDTVDVLGTSKIDYKKKVFGPANSSIMADDRHFVISVQIDTFVGFVAEAAFARAAEEQQSQRRSDLAVGT